MLEEQPSVVLIRMAGNLWSDFGCIFHITTSPSFQAVAEWYCHVKCPEETVEWRSKALLDAYGSELLAITKPFSAQQIFYHSLYISLRELCWHIRLLDSPGHEQICSAARRLDSTLHTQSVLHLWWVRREKQSPNRPKNICSVPLPYGARRARPICSDTVRQRPWQRDCINNAEVCLFYS